MLERFTNALGQTTVQGKVRLKERTALTRFEATMVAEPGTLVDYVALEGYIHIVSLTTPRGTFSAIKFTNLKGQH